MKRAFIKLTDKQRKELHSLFIECFHTGGALMAQVFTDGLHVAILPDEVAKRVAKATGAEYLPKGNSGFKAFSEAVDRDLKGGAK